MKKFTRETMETYAELVRLIGEQAHSMRGDEYYWTLVFDSCSNTGLEIEFSTKNDNPIIEMYETFDAITVTSVNTDVINTIIGYACIARIELTYSDLLHINKKN